MRLLLRFFLVVVDVVVSLEDGVQVQCGKRGNVTNDKKIDVSEHSSTVNVVPILQQARNLRLALPRDSQQGCRRVAHACPRNRICGPA